MENYLKAELEKITNTLQLAEEISQVGSWDWNFKTNKTWWSDGLFKIYGRKKESGTPSTENDEWLNTIHPDDREKVQFAINSAINNKGIYEVEYRLIRQYDKAIRTIYAKGRILNDENGNPERLLGTAQDITERKDFEEELFKKEELFRLLYQSSATGVGVYTVDGKIISYNEIALKYMGMKESDVVGKNLHEVFPKKDADVYSERIKATIKKNDSIKFEDKIELPTGSKWFLSVYSCIHNITGEIEGVQIMSLDITDRKEAQHNSTFLADAALELIKLTTPKEAYIYSANKLFELFNDGAVVAAVEFDNPNNRWKMIEVKGVNSFIYNGLKKIGIDLENWEGDTSSDFMRDAEKGKLIELEFDIHALCNGRFSGKLNSAIKKIIPVKKLLMYP